MKRHFLAFMSTVPAAMIVLATVMQPILYRTGLDRRTTLEVAQIIKLACASGVLAMMIYYAGYIESSPDPRLREKKNLWKAVIVLGNMFAVPVFWYLYVRDARK